MDSESCFNAILFKVIKKFELQAVSHPHSYKVSWINSTTLDVKQQCLVPVAFIFYKDKICCDVVRIDVGQIILCRS